MWVESELAQSGTEMWGAKGNTQNPKGHYRSAGPSHREDQ